MNLKLWENKLVASCLFDNSKIEDIFRVFKINDFTDECKEILTVMKDNLNKEFKFELDDLNDKLKTYIFEVLEKEYSSMNFDKYMSNFYEELRKNRLKKSLSNFKGDDFDTLRKKINKTFDENTNIFENKRTSLKEALDDFYDEADNFEDDKLIHLGFKHMNDWCTFDKGDLILIAGNTGMGKTAFALDLMLKSTTAGKHKVLFVSLEMDTSQVLLRLISNITNIPLKKLEKKSRKNLTDEEWGLIGLHHKKLVNHIDILDTSNTDVEFLMNEIKEMDKINNYDYIMIDYIGLIKSEGRSRYEIVTNSSLRCKKLARELRKPVIALAQLNRDNVKRADKKPELTDLKDSSQLEQDCSVGILLHSDEYHDKDKKSNEIVKITVFLDKNRNGRTGSFDCAFDRTVQSFTEDNRI